MAEDCATGLDFGPLFDLIGQFFANAAQTYFFRAVLDDPFDRHGPANRRRPFRNDNDAEAFAPFNPIPNLADNHIDIIGNLRNQNDISAAGHSGMKGNPAGIAAHDLQNHDPVVGLGRGVKPVQRPAGDPDRGIKAESPFGQRNVIVNRFWHTDHFDAQLLQFQRYGMRSVAAD